MRRLIMLMVIMMAVLALSAAEVGSESAEKDTAEFEIKGYKIAKSSEEVIGLVITDAITGSLNTIGGGYNEIDVSEHVGTLLGNASSNSEDFPSNQTIFSYRVYGYSPVSLNLKITFYPLTSGESNGYITAKYQLGNLSYSFIDESTDNTEAGDTIKEIEDTTVHSVLVEGAEGKSGSLLTSFSVLDGNDDGLVPRWAHRGAVAMTIDNTSYENAPISEKYSAKVTVTLSTQ